MTNNTEMILDKLASELENYDDVVNAETILTKIAFAKASLNILNKEEVEKVAAPNPALLEDVGSTMTKALVAGIGLGLAGEVIGAGHEKIKQMLFNSKINHLANEVKKVNPELQHAKTEDVKRMLKAGYTLAPDLMQNPTLAASFVGIGQSLGGKIDPNTMKLFAEAQNKSKGNKNPMLDMLPNAGSVI